MSDPAPINTFAPEEIAALEAEHEDVLVMRDPFEEEEARYTYVMRPAEPLAWRDFERKVNDKEQIAQALPVLVKSCVVAVAYKGEKAIGKDAARALWDRLLKRYPAAVSGNDLIAGIMKFNGAAKAAHSK